MLIIDAEGAFDSILHCILFEKAASALPGHCWSVMAQINPLVQQIISTNQMEQQTQHKDQSVSRKTARWFIVPILV